MADELAAARQKHALEQERSRSLALEIEALRAAMAMGEIRKRAAVVSNAKAVDAGSKELRASLQPTASTTRDDVATLVAGKREDMATASGIPGDTGDLVVKLTAENREMRAENREIRQELHNLLERVERWEARLDTCEKCTEKVRKKVYGQRGHGPAAALRTALYHEGKGKGQIGKS